MRDKQKGDGTGRKDKYNIPEELDYISAASANDCTGLIPRGVTGEEIVDYYHEIYPFGTPE